MDQLTDSQQKYYVDWFKTTPLWLDLGDIRVIHACWHKPSMEVVSGTTERKNWLSSPDEFVEANDRKSEVYEAVEILLKGPEIDLAKYDLPKFRDKGGDIRSKARNRWWMNSTELAEIAELSGCTDEHDKPYRDLAGIKAKPADQEFLYSDPTPVFYGHYWRENEPSSMTISLITRPASTSAPSNTVRVSAPWLRTDGRASRKSRKKITFPPMPAAAHKSFPHEIDIRPMKSAIE